MKAFNFAKQTNQLVRALPYLLFIFLLSFTLFVWQRVDYFNQTKAESVFINKTIEIKSRIKMRLEEHEKLLRGGVGLFNSVGNVTRTQWRQYVAALELDQNHPGIQGVGFSIWLKPNEKSANIVKIRTEGFPDYTINPEGERSFYTSIIYLEPFNWRNQRAFGYDMYSEPIRKKAIDQAIDTGIATITNKIILLEETEVEKQSGILMYVPVYRVGSVIDSAEARRRAIKGLVYSPIRMQDFIFASIGNNYQDVAIEIYDEGAQSANKLLYPSKNTESKNATSTYLSRFEKKEKFIIFHDREWQLHFKSLPIFDSAVKNNDAYFVLVFGIILSCLLSFITYSSLEARQRSLKLVEEKTKELKASESSYRAIHDNSPLGIVQLDSNYRFVSANPAFVQILGYTEPELKQKTIFTVTHPDDINNSNAAEKIFTKQLGTISRLAKRYLHKNGKIVWALVSSRTVRSEETGEELIFSIIEDITERVQFEKNLKTSEQKFQAVLRASEIAIAWANEKSEIEYINPKFISLFGYSVDDIHTLEQWYLCAYPDPIYRNKVIAEWNTKVSKSLPAKTAIEPMEVSVTCKNGSVRHVLLAGSWFENNILANFSDITERKRMETELQLAASVFSNSFDGIIISNAKNLILDVSPSFSRITGYNRNEVIGKTPKMFSSGRHDSEFYAQMWYSLNKYDFWSGEIWNRRKNGEIFPLTLSISAVKNKENQVQHYVAFFSDISVIKKNEATLIEARQQAEAATLAKSRFLATMSHEIRTPMNGILGMAQLLAMTNVSDAERQEYAQIIINSGNVLLTLLNDILDFSKVEAGKIELEHVVIDPKQIIQDTQMLFADTARRKSLNYESAWLGPTSKYYLSDPYRLRQMLSNLISNAIKFTEHGKIRIEACEVSHNDKIAMLEFSVTDTGIGIPANKLSKLFEPFSQSDSSTARKYGGTGLGLSIVASLAKMMGGEVGASSVPNQGSRFWFQILAEYALPEQSHEYLSSHNGDFDFTATPINLTGRVLVVDDDGINRLVIEKFLSKLGLQATTVDNGHQALDLILRGEPFDLILMDLQMPIMNGQVTTQQIRKWEEESNHPRHQIIAFTADAFEETKTSCIAFGMDGVLTKPVTMRALKDLLSQALS